MKPAAADYRKRKLLILRAPEVEYQSVTAEVAGSSSIVPATDFSGMIFRQMSDEAEPLET